jgi:hypothetical protein
MGHVHHDVHVLEQHDLKLECVTQFLGKLDDLPVEGLVLGEQVFIVLVDTFTDRVRHLELVHDRKDVFHFPLVRGLIGREVGNKDRHVAKDDCDGSEDVLCEGRRGHTLSLEHLESVVEATEMTRQCWLADVGRVLEPRPEAGQVVCEERNAEHHGKDAHKVAVA